MPALSFRMVKRQEAIDTLDQESSLYRGHLGISLKKKKKLNYLFGCARSQSWQDGSSYLTRDRTQYPCFGSMESQTMDHQGSVYGFLTGGSGNYFLQSSLLTQQNPILMKRFYLAHVSKQLIQTVRNLLQCGRPGFDPWVRKIFWRREWLLTPVFLPRELHAQRSLAGYSPWGCKQSDTTDQQTLSLFHGRITWPEGFSPP